MQIVTEDNREYLLFFNEDARKLYKYDLATQAIHDSILIDIYPHKYIEGIKYHTRDSIFVVCSPSNGNYSGTVWMLNGKGEIIKKYSLKGLPIKCDECGKINQDSLESISIDGGLVYSNHHLFIQMRNYNLVGDEDYMKMRHPVSAHIDTQKDSAITHPIFIPSRLGAQYAFNDDQFVNVVVNKKGNLVAGFYMTSSLTEYDLENKKIVLHKIRSVFGDTVFPLKEIPPLDQIYPQYDYSQVSFECLYYNPYQNNYVRFTRLALPSNPLPEEKRRPRLGVTILDADFNVIAEGILPKGLSQTIDFSKNGIVIWDRDKTEEMDTNKVFFREYKLSYEKIGLAEFKKEMAFKRDSLAFGSEPYLKVINFNAPEKKFVVFFNAFQSGCQQCMDNMTQIILQMPKNNPCYIILAAYNRDAIDEYIKNQDLGSFDKLVTDNTAWLKYIDKSIFGSIWYFDNNKLVKETKVMIDNEEEIKLEIDSFFAK